MTANSNDVFALIEREQGRYLAELKEYLRIPSISTDPDYKADVERCAEWLVAKLQAAGLTSEKIATGAAYSSTTRLSMPPMGRVFRSAAIAMTGLKFRALVR